MNAPSIPPAFRDAALESQAVFRTLMEAMACPGRIFPLVPGFVPPKPLNAVAAAIILTLADFETPVCADGRLSENAEVRDFLRFHTGARLTFNPTEAAFAVIADPRWAPPLDVFARGSLEYPEQSTTIIYQVAELSADRWIFEGPGIRERVSFSASPMPLDFPEQLAENRALFPRGNDFFFAAPGAIAALPRSARLIGGCECMWR